MNKSELNKELKRLAINKGLCDQWQEDWKEDWDLEQMVRRFFLGIDFFLKERFVSNEFLKENFGKDFLRRNAILVDDCYSLLFPKYAILIGDSRSTIRSNGYKVSTIYITDNSNAKIVSRDHSTLIVHMLGTAQVEIQQYDDSHVAVITHSPESVVISDQNITIKEEFDYLK